MKIFLRIFYVNLTILAVQYEIGKNSGGVKTRRNVLKLDVVRYSFVAKQAGQTCKYLFRTLNTKKVDIEVGDIFKEAEAGLCILQYQS